MMNRSRISRQAANESGIVSVKAWLGGLIEHLAHFRGGKLSFARFRSIRTQERPPDDPHRFANQVSEITELLHMTHDSTAQSGGLVDMTNGRAEQIAHFMNIAHNCAWLAMFE